MVILSFFFITSFCNLSAWEPENILGILQSVPKDSTYTFHQKVARKESYKVKETIEAAPTLASFIHKKIPFDLWYEPVVYHQVTNAFAYSLRILDKLR